MKYPKLRGKRCIFLMRCSTNEQAATSLPDQERLLADFAAEHQCHCVGKVKTAVSGSVPGARSDLAGLVLRKRQQNDFDFVLLQDLSRLTRAGQQHGGRIESELADVGVEIVYAAENLPDDEDNADLVKSIGLYSAKKTVKNLSHASSRGGQSKLEAGELVHASQSNYGVDRLYIGRDGDERHIIHRLPDGSSQRLNAKTRVVEGTYRGTYRDAEGNKVCDSYRKQPDERVVFVPGEIHQQEIVRRIFREKLLDGRGYWRIAIGLNDDLKTDNRYASPNGKEWSIGCIANILQNPVYTGTTWANRKAGGLYNNRNHGHPEPVIDGRIKLGNRKWMPKTLRSQDEWIEIPQPAIGSFLDPELRALAITWQEQKREAQLAGRAKLPAAAPNCFKSAGLKMGGR